jgi:hypothetical protein
MLLSALEQIAKALGAGVEEFLGKFSSRESAQDRACEETDFSLGWSPG